MTPLTTRLVLYLENSFISESQTNQTFRDMLSHCIIKAQFQTSHHVETDKTRVKEACYSHFRLTEDSLGCCHYKVNTVEVHDQP